MFFTSPKKKLEFAFTFHFFKTILKLMRKPTRNHKNDNKSLQNQSSMCQYLTYRFSIFAFEDMRVFEFFSVAFSGTKTFSASPATAPTFGSAT